MENTQFSIQVKCFKLVGLNRQQLQNPNKTKHLLHFLIAVPLIFGVSSVMSFAIQNFRDIMSSCEAYAIIFTGTIALSKLATFCFFKEKFFEIMDEIKLLSKQGRLINNLTQILNFMSSSK